MNRQVDTIEDNGCVVPVFHVIILEYDFSMLWPPRGTARAFDVQRRLGDTHLIFEERKRNQQLSLISAHLLLTHWPPAVGA